MINIKQTLLSMLPRGSSPRGNIIVRLAPGSRQPQTRVEQLAVSVLASQGAIPLDTLAERVASELYHQELRKGAQVLDIGLFGSRLFLPDVIGEIEARNGTLWRIENLVEC
ncbi:MAG TPA: hypothetical protein VLJ79_30270 [Candidatus Binatia bacterium]|nr:hypothetical protein [Candidatus Binatia bacterium]